MLILKQLLPCEGCLPPALLEMGRVFRGHESRSPLQKPKHRVGSQAWGGCYRGLCSNSQAEFKSVTYLEFQKSVQWTCKYGKPWELCSLKQIWCPTPQFAQACIYGPLVFLWSAGGSNIPFDSITAWQGHRCSWTCFQLDTGLNV